MSDISKEPIKMFLDAADTVLNSNTFFLSYLSQKGKDISNGLLDFINSQDFKEQITKQDLEREWYNMYIFDDQSEGFKLKAGNLVKTNFLMKISTPSVDKKEYLIAMLTADKKVNNFFSPYKTQKERGVALKIVDNFINYLFLDESWSLFSIYPNFLYNADDIGEASANIRYFEGDHGCNTATLLVSGSKHFLLLTNGID